MHPLIINVSKCKADTEKKMEYRTDKLMNSIWILLVFVVFVIFVIFVLSPVYFSHYNYKCCSLELGDIIVMFIFLPAEHHWMDSHKWGDLGWKNKRGRQNWIS